MPRETQRRKTQREQVELRPYAPPALQPQRRAFSNGGVSNRAAREAAAIADAFGVGVELFGNIAEKRAEKFSLAGQKAALEGREPTDEEKRQDAFLRGYQQVLDDRDMVELEAQAVELYKTFDPASMTQEQVASKLDELFRSQYEGADLEDELTRDSMKRILPRWEQVQEKILAQHQTDVAESVQNEVDVAVIKSVDHELKNTGTLDLEALNEKLFKVYGPKQANAELVSIVTAEAVKLGKPELIEQLRQKRSWKGGAAAPGGIREFDTALQNALQQARAQEQYNEARAEKEREEAQAEFEDEADQQIMLALFDGNAAAVPGMLADFIREIDYYATKARQWVNFANAYQRASVADAQPDWNAVSDLELRILNGEATLDDITAAAEANVLGSGKELADVTTRLARNLRAAQSAIRNDPKFTSRLGELKAIYSAPYEYEQTLPEIKQRRAEAIRRWSDLIFDEGLDPQAALDRVQQELEPKDKSYWDRMLDATPVDSSAVISRWRSGQASPAAVLDAAPADTAPADYLLDLLESGDITADEYNKLKTEVAR